eukprot:CAMPEP_0206539484 /NCGR_PEP_ID=MMETSP0325_2-20121206/8455_1 /ASSEMBLY_ACC=CAM_ASM_000347 /TAXON_ID=2866 /ORGANISM="Crypthecodinium cohnii, Strain Seligo" /LENGTH=376 /DNA_ID=CAMNT_0054037061 /DNA_START=72 /DNA_END=1202 /DNA_ORIENTATION=+
MNWFGGSDHGSSSDEESNGHSGHHKHGPPSSVVITQADFERLVRGRAFKSWEEFVETLPDVEEGHVQRYHEGQSESVFKLDPLQILGWVASLGVFSSIISLIVYTETSSRWEGLVITGIYGGLLWLGLTYASPRVAGILWPHLPCIASFLCFEVDQMLAKDAIKAENWQPHILLAVVVPHFACAFWLLRWLPEDPDRSVLACNVYLGILAMALILYSLKPGSQFDQAFWDYCNQVLIIMGIVFILFAIRLFRYPTKWGPIELVSWLLNVACAGIWLACSNLLLTSNRGVAEWVAFTFAFIAMWVLGSMLDRTGPLLFAVIGFGQVVIKLAWECSSTGGVLWGLVCGGLVAVLFIGFGHFYSKSRARSQAMALGLLG